jgi:hypothetical protein
VDWLLRAAGVAAQFALKLLPSFGADAITLVTCLEHLFGGAITTGSGPGSTAAA